MCHEPGCILKVTRKTVLAAMQEHSGHCHNNQFQDFQTPTIRAGSPVLELRLNESISSTSPQPHVKPKPWSSHNNGLFCQFGITTSPTQTFEGTAQHRINLTKPTQLGLHLWERKGKKKIEGWNLGLTFQWRYSP